MNKERGLILCSFASGKASVTIFSQPEMCTVTLSNPHNMLRVIRLHLLSFTVLAELRPI